MRAIIIDGEELFRLSLREVIAVAGPFTTIVEADSEASFMITTAQLRNIDLVVIYPSSIGGWSGGDTCSYLTLTRRLYPKAAVISFSNCDTVQHAMLHGDITILPRSSSVEMIASTIRSLLQLPPLSSSRNMNPSAPNVRPLLQRAAQQPEADTSAQLECLSKLSGRQRQILLMTADGLANKEIAARLGIAEGTVKAHMHAIFKALEVTNRTQAVVRFGNLARPSEAQKSSASSVSIESASQHQSV